MNGRWISAVEAFERLTKFQSVNVSATLCARASDGIVATKAQTLFMGDRRLDDADIPAEFWGGGRTRITKQNWKIGDFESWINQSIHCRAYAVSFLEQDIDAMLPNTRPNPEMSRFGSGNFAMAGRCVAELLKTTKLPAAEVQSEIIRHCRAQLIDSRCATLRDETLDRYGSEVNEATNIQIPSWFWECCVTRPEAILDWNSGRFAGFGTVDDDLHRVRLTGVEFDVSNIVDLEAMLVAGRPTSSLENEVAATESSAPVSSRGRKPVYEWEAAIHAVWGKIYRAELIPKNQAYVEKALMSVLRKGDDEPSESTVRPYANRIWREFSKEA